MSVQSIVESNRIEDKKGFSKAMSEMKSISEGELRYLLVYESGGQSAQFKKKQALAKAELERRKFNEQKKLSYLSAIFGLVGVLCGAALQAILNVAF